MNSYFKIHNQIISSFIEPPIDLNPLKHPLRDEFIDIKIYEEDHLIAPFSLSNKNLIISNLNETWVLEKDLFLARIFDKGSKVQIKKLKMTNTSKHLISKKLLNLILPFCLYQKKKFVLHASGITKNGKTSLFLGKSGSGKSTLASTFLDYDFCTEDIVSLEKENKKVYANPSFAYVKLTEEVAKKFKANLGEKRALLDDRLNRSFYKVNNFLDKKTEIKNFFFLEWGDKESVRELNSTEIFVNLMKSSIGCVPKDSCRLSHDLFFSYAEIISNNANFYSFIRKKGSLENQKKLIENYI